MQCLLILCIQDILLQILSFIVYVTFMHAAYLPVFMIQVSACSHTHPSFTSVADYKVVQYWDPKNIPSLTKSSCGLYIHLGWSRNSTWMIMKCYCRASIV